MLETKRPLSGAVVILVSNSTAPPEWGFFMSKNTILMKALEKAYKNGYDNSMFGEYCESYCGSESCYTDICIYTTIFDHEFAKAFWGSEPWCSACQRHHDSFSDCDCGIGNDSLEWHVRLQLMVLFETPLDYLKEFLD